MEPSVAGYSYLLNSNVHAGSDRNITGPYFSNGGIEMDGTNNSTVSSAVSSWVCNSTYGCSPTQNNAPGVLGSGSGSALWQYPVSSIDFDGHNVGLSNLKTYAKNDGGLYFPPAGSGTANENQRGYHLIFDSNGTVDVYKVTSTTPVLRLFEPAIGAGDTTSSHQTYLGNYTVPPTCAVIFVEDRAWVEGIVKGKVTVAAADFINSNNTTQTRICSGNIYYSGVRRHAGLTVIAAGNVLIPLNSPEHDGGPRHIRRRERQLRAGLLRKTARLTHVSRRPIRRTWSEQSSRPTARSSPTARRGLSGIAARLPSSAPAMPPASTRTTSSRRSTRRRSPRPPRPTISSSMEGRVISLEESRKWYNRQHEITAYRQLEDESALLQGGQEAPRSDQEGRR